MNLIDVEEFARLSGKTESYIRRLCREDKLPFIQELVPQTGRMKYLIDIDLPEAKKYLVPIQIQNNTASEQVQEPQQNFNNTETLQHLLNAKDYIINLQKQLIQYAEKAGQVQLLEDIEKRKENEYLRQVAELKAENEKLKEQLNKKSGFMGLFKK